MRTAVARQRGLVATALPLVLLLPLVGACRSLTNLPTHHMSPNAGPTALQRGRLEYDDPCVLLVDQSQGHRWLVVWPSGTSLDGDSIIDSGGHPEAHIGDTVDLGGGAYGESDYKFVRGLMEADVPEGCRCRGLLACDGR